MDLPLGWVSGTGRTTSAGWLLLEKIHKQSHPVMFNRDACKPTYLEIHVHSRGERSPQLVTYRNEYIPSTVSIQIQL